MRPSFRIFSAWFFGSLAVGLGLIFLLRPMAGLFFLLLIATLLGMTVAPIAHILIRHKGYKPSEAAFAVLFGLIGLVFMLALTGRFNYT